MPSARSTTEKRAPLFDATLLALAIATALLSAPRASHPRGGQRHHVLAKPATEVDRSARWESFDEVFDKGVRATTLAHVMPNLIPVRFVHAWRVPRSVTSIASEIGRYGWWMD